MALEGLAVISEKNGNEKEAIDYYNKIIEIDRYNDDAIIKLANYYKDIYVLKSIELLKKGSSEKSDTLLKELLQNELDKLTDKSYSKFYIKEIYEYSIFYHNFSEIENTAYACYNMYSMGIY